MQIKQNAKFFNVYKNHLISLPNLPFIVFTIINLLYLLYLLLSIYVSLEYNAYLQLWLIKATLKIAETSLKQK